MPARKTLQRTELLKYSHTIGLSTMEGRGFYYPTDTAIGPDGRLYVVSRSLDGDTRGVRVTVCDVDSEYYGTFGAYGEEPGQMIWPTSIVIDSKGRAYVACEYTNRITIFDAPSGKYLDRWGAQGSGRGELDGPSGLACDADDNIYVVDHLNSRVQKFTGEGRFLLAFGSEGDGEGEFNLPWGIAVGPDGNVYVADWRNDRVQQFSPDGKFIASYGVSGQGDGEFRRPASVAVDDEGFIYVADWGNERVQVLDPDGSFLLKLRGEATHSRWAEDFLRVNVEEAEARAKADLEPKIEYFVDDPHEESSHIEKYFWAPTSVKLDAHNRLYVTESNRHRIQIYQKV
jgi:DNA-binding beta-propeller fold protein YncE